MSSQQPTNNATELFRKMLAGPAVRQGPSDSQSIDAMIERSLAIGPMQTQSIEEPFLLEKLKNLLLPHETILAFCGRCGLGPRPLREWDIERIANFLVLQAEQEKPQFLTR
jgi:hypothetical protein